MTELDADQIARMRLMSGGALYDYALRLVDEVVRLRATIERVEHESAARAAALAAIDALPKKARPMPAQSDSYGTGWADALRAVDAIRALGPAGADRHNCAQLRATIEAVAEALAGDGQAVLKVADAQQVLIDADRQEQP